MIYTTKNQVDGIYYGQLQINAIYFGKTLVWELKTTPPEEPDYDELNSCYAQGYWIDDYPWTDEDSWPI